MQEIGFAPLSLIFTILHASYLQIKYYICNLLIAFLLALSVMLPSGYVQTMSLNSILLGLTKSFNPFVF